MKEESKKTLKYRKKEFETIDDLYNPIDEGIIQKMVVLEYLIFRDFLKLSPKTINKTLKELENIEDFSQEIDERRKQRDLLKKIIKPYKIENFYRLKKDPNTIAILIFNYKINYHESIKIHNCRDIDKYINDLKEKIKTTSNNKAISKYKRDICLLKEIKFKEIEINEVNKLKKAANNYIDLPIESLYFKTEDGYQLITPPPDPYAKW